MNVDWSNAYPTNRERNTILAGIFKQHVLYTHPTASSHDLLPNQRTVIEDDFQTTPKKTASSLKVNNTLRHRILTTCGDDNITYGSHKHADCFMSIHWNQPNMHDVKQKMEEKPPQGNGTVCTLISVKIKQDAASHIWHEFYGKKVWMVNINGDEWLTVELADDLDEIVNIKQELD